MTDSSKHTVLLVWAWIALSASLLALLAVADRLFAAVWQWYKFSGYETAGVVTLSIQTAWLFAGVMGGLILVTLLIRHLDAGAGGRVSAIARRSFWISIVASALFVLLGLSGLNHWRP